MKCPIRWPLSAALSLFVLLAGLTPTPALGQEADAESQQDFSGTLSTGSWNPSPEELEQALEDWLDQYVTYIITDEERQIFESLPTPEMKLAFTERFWDVRDPTPGTARNEYRETHFERWVTANRRFAAGKAGWNTDRGRTYILLGPPNNLEMNPTGRGAMERASQVWTYNMPDNPNLPGVLDLYFVDFHGTGEYELVESLDAAKIVSRQFGYINHPLDLVSLRRHANAVYDEKFLTYRFNDPTRYAGDFLDFQQNLREVLRMPEIHLDRIADLRRADAVADVEFDALPLARSVDFYAGPGDGTTVQVTLALEHDRLQASPYGDSLHFSTDMYVALERGGEVVSEDEKRLNFSLTSEERQQMAGTQVLQSFQLLAPAGDYDLVLLVRDNAAERIGRAVEPVSVPALSAGDTLQVSSLTLASRIQRVTPGEGAPREFQIGDMRIVPNVNRTYFQDQTLLLYFQAYGLDIDPESGANRVALRGEVLRDGERVREIATQHPYPAPMTRQSFSLGFPLNTYGAGVYQVVLELVDEVSGASEQLTADFAVLPAQRGGTGR